jgi:hypothetical protein
VKTTEKPLTTRQALENVAPNLFRHKLNGNYYGIRKVAGKKKSHALGTADRGTANRELKDWLNKLDRVDPTASDLRVDGLIEKFAKIRKHKAESTKESERIMGECLRNHLGANLLVARVKPSDVDMWLTAATKGMRHSSINRWHQFARQLFRLAVDDGVIAESPFVKSHHPAKKKQKVLRMTPSVEEFEKIVREIRQPNWQVPKGKRGGQRPKFQHESADFVEFEGRAGLGQAEVSALTWEDINETTKPAMPRGFIRVRRAKTDTYFEIPIYAGLVPVIVGMRERAKGAKLIGRLFRIDDVKHALTSACERLRLPNFTQRNLRQMRIVEMIRAGINPKLVAEYQGHRDGGILVMQIYTDVFGSGDEAWKAAELAKDDPKVIPFSSAAGCFGLISGSSRG